MPETGLQANGASPARQLPLRVKPARRGQWVAHEAAQVARPPLAAPTAALCRQQSPWWQYYDGGAAAGRHECDKGCGAARQVAFL